MYITLNVFLSLYEGIKNSEGEVNAFEEEI